MYSLFDFFFLLCRIRSYFVWIFCSVSDSLYFSGDQLIHNYCILGINLLVFVFWAWVFCDFFDLFSCVLSLNGLGCFYNHFFFELKIIKLQRLQLQSIKSQSFNCNHYLFLSYSENIQFLFFFSFFYEKGSLYEPSNHVYISHSDHSHIFFVIQAIKNLGKGGRPANGI